MLVFSDENFVKMITIEEVPPGYANSFYRNIQSMFALCPSGAMALS
jgi:hypothetical protein